MQKYIPNVLVLGIGGGAGKIISCIANDRCAHWLHLAHIDTDAVELTDHNKVETLLIERYWGEKNYSKKDTEEIFTKVLAAFPKVSEKLDFLLIISCLGKEIGSHASQAFSRFIYKKRDILTIFLVALPFAFEGNYRRSIAENSLESLRRSTHLILPIKNDLLFSSFPANIPPEEIFQKANESLATGVVGITEFIRCRSPLPLGIKNLEAFLRKKDSFFSLGVKSQSSKNDKKEFIESVLQSPTLGGKQAIDQADAILGVISGGSDMSMEEMKIYLQILASSLDSSIKTLFGGHSVPERDGQVQLTILVVYYQESFFSSSQASAEKRGDHHLVDHAFFSSRNINDLPSLSYGDNLGIFRHALATIHHGENLDLPTFKRLGIKINDFKK